MSTPARLRAVVTLALSTALAAAAVPAVQAADSTPADGAFVKTRAADAVLEAARQGRHPAADLPTVSDGAREAATARRTVERRPSSTGDLAAPAGPTAAAAPACDALGLDLTSTNDQVWLHWDASAATSYTVYRQRYGGAWTRLASLAGTATSYRDRGVNPRGAFTYRLDADGASCPLGTWWSMSTEDGWGEVDAVYGGAGDGDALMAQDTWTLAMPTGGTGWQPSFSPDGRRVVTAAQSTSGGWQLQVTDSSGRATGAQAFPQPEGFVGLEPNWSPDGRTIVYTRYTVGADDTLSQPGLRLLDTLDGTDRAVDGGEGLLQADWRSGTSLVAAGAVEGEGLFTIAVSGGTPAAVPGTQDAGAPEVGPDGRIWYVENDGTTASVRNRAPDGSVTVVDESTTGWFEQPRTSPGGRAFYVRVERNDPADPADDSFSVVDAATGEDTTIGAPRDAGLAGFNGYDVRQPASKGTSDLVGNAGPDIIARDSVGDLWAYPSTSTAIAGRRVRIGRGWDIYTAFLAAGDLNGDNRADILARDKDGRLWRYDGLGGGRLAARVQVGAGWASLVPVAPGDWDGDQRADLVAKASTGALWLYPGDGRGGFLPRRQLGSGWQVMNAVVGVGDFDLDNDADLLAREASTGKLFLYPGNGTGGFAPRRQVGAGWQVFPALAGPELLGTNPVVYAKRNDGVLLAYFVMGDGRFDGNEVYVVGTGWTPYSLTS